MITNVNNEDRLVQQTFADHLRDSLGWDSIYAFDKETFGENGTLGRATQRDIVLSRDLRSAIVDLNPDLPAAAVDKAVEAFTTYDFSRSTLQHNREFYKMLRDGIPVQYQDENGHVQKAAAQVINFREPGKNRFLAVRELWIQGLQTPHYRRRADLVCFVNGIPLVFFELKAVYLNIKAGFDNNLSDYADTIPHAFYHNGFLIVSNGDKARYGSITSEWEHFAEWKRQDERDTGSVDARVMLDGMLAKDALLDIIENFVLFDAGKPGATRKIIGRNHQILGVNNAVESVRRQVALKERYPERLTRRKVHSDAPATIHPFVPPEEMRLAAEPGRRVSQPVRQIGLALPLVQRAHPDLGRLGVFWHTQGSGKSYSMIFFAEKVRRTIPGNFTFLIMTDREDLDKQIHDYFVGCGVADEKTPRAATGTDLKRLLKEDHRYVFSLIHKFNQDVSPQRPYNRRDDIIVLSDEAHRTQAGKLARNMRVALPNAAFIGFTGTPLFKDDELTRRIFGDYVSRYDFKRSEEDGSTVKLIYENRGEKLGIARADLNDRIMEKIQEANLDPDKTAKLERLLGQDYEVVTADDRLDKLADDLVDHCSARWQSGKAMLVCIDKITCARMHDRVTTRWKKKVESLRQEANAKASASVAAGDADEKERIQREWDALRDRIGWMESTLIHLVISEAQNEVKDFKKWGFDIKPHRALLKQGFETPEGKRLKVDAAFKDPAHPFRIAIVCAMWLTGFDVECLATLYIDKPMKAHNIMQAIARANRVYGDKKAGVIVDYNGVLRSLREALAQYAIGDPDDNGGGGGGDGPGPDVVEPLEVLIAALAEALQQTEEYLRDLGFDVSRLVGARGFDRIEALRDATDAVYTSDETKRRFEIMAREVFARFKAVIAEPAAYDYAERHDNVEAVYRKLQEKRDKADVTELLKELHKIVNEAIRTRGLGDDQAEGLTVDLSRVDFEKLRDEFAKRARRKHCALADIRQVVEDRLAAMLAANPNRMDYYAKYQEIIAAYNREKDRATVEETFVRLMNLDQALDVEQRRAVRENLSEDELALFDMLSNARISKKDREAIKQASRQILASLLKVLQPMPRWFDNTQTRAEVYTSILDQLYEVLPSPPFTEDETDAAADRIYEYVWQRCATGQGFAVAQS